MILNRIQVLDPLDQIKALRNCGIFVKLSQSRTVSRTSLYEFAILTLNYVALAFIPLLFVIIAMFFYLEACRFVGKRLNSIWQNSLRL